MDSTLTTSANRQYNITNKRRGVVMNGDTGSLNDSDIIYYKEDFDSATKNQLKKGNAKPPKVPIANVVYVNPKGFHTIPPNYLMDNYSKEKFELESVTEKSNEQSEATIHTIPINNNTNTTLDDQNCNNETLTAPPPSNSQQTPEDCSPKEGANCNGFDLMAPPPTAGGTEKKLGETSVFSKQNSQEEFQEIDLGKTLMRKDHNDKKNNILIEDPNHAMRMSSTNARKNFKTIIEHSQGPNEPIRSVSPYIEKTSSKPLPLTERNHGLQVEEPRLSHAHSTFNGNFDQGMNKQLVNRQQYFSHKRMATTAKPPTQGVQSHSQTFTKNKALSVHASQDNMYPLEDISSQNNILSPIVDKLLQRIQKEFKGRQEGSNASMYQSVERGNNTHKSVTRGENTINPTANKETWEVYAMLDHERKKTGILQQRLEQKTRALEELRGVNERLSLEFEEAKDGLNNYKIHTDMKIQELETKSEQLLFQVSDLEDQNRRLGDENQRLRQLNKEIADKLAPLEQRNKELTMNLTEISKKYEGKILGLFNSFERQKNILEDEVKNLRAELKTVKQQQQSNVLNTNFGAADTVSDYNTVRGGLTTLRKDKSKTKSCSRSRGGILKAIVTEPNEQEGLSDIGEGEGNNEYDRIQGGGHYLAIRTDHKIREVAEINKKILNELELVLGVPNKSDIITTVKTLQDKYRKLVNLADSLVETMVQCSPSGYYDLKNNRPSLKQAWKWIRSVIEELVALKKQISLTNTNGSNETFGGSLGDTGGTCTPPNKEMIEKLNQITLENNMLGKIISKVKTMLKLEWVHTLTELERQIDSTIFSNSKKG